MARQHNSIPTSAKLRRGDDKPQMPITRPSTATIAAGGHSAAKIAENRPNTSDVTVPPIAINPARRASISSAVDAGREDATRSIADGKMVGPPGPNGDPPAGTANSSTMIASSG